MATPISVCMPVRKSILITQIAAIMYGMYIINGVVYMGQNQARQEETHHAPHRFRRLFLGLLLMGWRGCVSAMGVIKTPILLFWSKIHYVINLYITVHISSRGVFGINHIKLRNVWYIDGPWWSMVACRLNFSRPSTTAISIGMEGLSLVKLLFIYLKRSAIIIKYSRGCEI